MDLGLTKEQVMIRETARELATNEIAPIAAEIEESSRFPGEVMEACFSQLIMLADTIKTILVVLLIVGTVLASVAHWFYFKPVLGLGSALFLIGLLMSMVGFMRGL